MMHNYYFFSIDYYGLKIDSVMFLPDDKTVEQPRVIPLEVGSREKIMKIPLTVRSYYPSWKIDTDKLDCGENIEFENMKKVHWDSYIHDMRRLRDLTNDPNTKEDFNIPPDFTDDNPDYEKLK